MKDVKLFLEGWIGSYLPRWAKAVTLVGVLAMLVLILLPRSLTRSVWATGLYFAILLPLLAIRVRFWWTRVLRPYRQREADGDERSAALMTADREHRPTGAHGS